MSDVCPMPTRRLRSCVEAWPDCFTGGYDPSCCRFPKSCSATVYDEEDMKEEDLEPAPGPWLAPAPAVDLLEAAARAAHRSQFVDPAVADLVWSSTTDAYRHQWEAISRAACEVVVARAVEQALREVHAEIAQRPGYAEVADLVDARADEWAERAREAS
jgi:hypothetical protein